jgi:hypothetical protein
VVDLVADQADVVLGAPAGEGGELVGADHRAGGVGRRREDQPGERAAVGDDRIEGVRGRLEPGLGADRHLDRLDVECQQHVAVGGVAGPHHRHPVAGIERGQEHEDERARRAGGDGHRGGVDVEAVPAAVVRGDRGAELDQAQRAGVAERVATGVE